MADVSVRVARPDDAAAVGMVQVQTWQQAYAEILPADVLASLTAEVAGQSWREAIASPPTARHRVLVAFEQSWLVGFVALAPAEQEGVVEIGPLLVEPRWGRRGHGSRLLAAAVDHAVADGMTTAHAWLPERDNASQALMREAGWAPDGTVRGLDTGSGEIREIGMHVSLAG
jgi:GNAT superfamily N-acetyltransferase